MTDSYYIASLIIMILVCTFRKVCQAWCVLSVSPVVNCCLWCCSLCEVLSLS